MSNDEYQPPETPGAQPGKPGFTFGDTPIKDDIPVQRKGPSFSYGDKPMAKVEDSATSKGGDAAKSEGAGSRAGFGGEAKGSRSKESKDPIGGQWKRIESAARVKWSRLTDDDFKRVGGDIVKLGGRIQELYGHDRVDVSNQLDAIVNEIGEDKFQADSGGKAKGAGKKAQEGSSAPRPGDGSKSSARP